MEPYTIIDYKQKQKYHLNYSEYCVIDYIEHASKDSSYFPGWCFARVTTISRHLALSRRQVTKTIKVLKEKVLIEENDKGHFKVVVEWKRRRKEDTFYNWHVSPYTKFNHSIRKKLKLSFREYAFLKLAQNAFALDNHRINHNKKQIKHDAMYFSVKTIAERLGVNQELVLYPLIKQLKRKGFIHETGTVYDTKEKKHVPFICFEITLQRLDEYSFDEVWNVPELPETENQEITPLFLN